MCGNKVEYDQCLIGNGFTLRRDCQKCFEYTLRGGNCHKCFEYTFRSDNCQMCFEYTFRGENSVKIILDTLSEGRHITKTRLYNCDPLKSHFYIVKLGFTGVYIILLILLKKTT